MQKVSLSFLEIVQSNHHSFLFITDLYFILILQILDKHCSIIEGTLLVLSISLLLCTALVTVGFDIKMLLLLLQPILRWRTLLQFFDVDLCASWDVEWLCVLDIVFAFFLAEFVGLH